MLSAWLHYILKRVFIFKIYSIFGTLSVILVYVLPFLILAVLNLMIIVRLRQRPFQTTSSSSTTGAINNVHRVSSVNNSFAAMTTTATTITNRPSHLLVPNCIADELSSTSTPVAPSTMTSSCTNNYSSKNDRNLSITLVTLAVTFMIFTFPFQANWFYENKENIYKAFFPSSNTSPAANVIELKCISKRVV